MAKQYLFTYLINDVDIEWCFIKHALGKQKTTFRERLVYIIEQWLKTSSFMNI